MTWFVFSVLSVFSLASAELLQQHIINKGNKIFDDKLSGFFTFGTPAVLMIPFIVFQFGSETFILFRLAVFPYFLLASLFSALGTIFYLKSFNVKSISYSTLFVSSSAVFSTLLGILIYKESIAPVKFLGIILILTSLVFINIKNETFEKTSLWGLLAGLFYGSLYIFDKWFVLNIDPLLYLFWSLTFTAIFLLMLNPKHIINKLPYIHIQDLRTVLISGFAYVTYNLFTFLSYVYGGEVGIVDSINNSQIFLIILYEILLLKQQDKIIRKLISFGLALCGVVILGGIK